MQEHLTDKLFREKFTDFSSEPSKHLWEVLEEKLEQKKSKHKKYVWLSWAIVFLMVATFLIFNFIQNEKKWYAKNNAYVKSSNSISTTASHNTSTKLLDVAPKEILQEKKQAEKQITSPSLSKELPQRKSDRKFHKTTTQMKEITEKSIEKDTLRKVQEVLSDELKASKESNNINDDTLKSLPKPKGTKIIIKLPEPEPSKEGKARDFASTKFGKFLKNVQKLKNAELKLTLNSKSPN
ncbi:hypothetical protein [Raineya sp.]|jgi:hypothetical protein